MLVLLFTSFWSEREATGIGRLEDSGPSAQSEAAAHAAFMARVTSHRSTLSGMGLSHGQPRFWLSGTLCDSFPQHCHALGIMLCCSDRHALPSVVSGSDMTWIASSCRPNRTAKVVGVVCALCYEVLLAGA